MLTPRFLVLLFAISFAFLYADAAPGQSYPSKPIRIVTGGSGGAGDIALRLIAQELTVSWGQQVIVDNRGGSVVIPAEIVAKAPPDGHTLLLYSGVLWIFPLLQANVSYDAVRDFAPVTIPISSPNILVVHSSVPVKSVKELIALAKARPGELNYASGATGAPTHLAAELFKSMAKVNIVRIPYKGSGPALGDLVAGQVQLMFAPAGSVGPHVKSGRLRALAVTSAQPSTLLPGLPTVAATGLPGYEATSVWGLFAPARTPAPIINRLNHEIVQILNKPDVKEKFLTAGVEVVGNTPEAFAATVKSEIGRMGKMIKNAGIRDE